MRLGLLCAVFAASGCGAGVGSTGAAALARPGCEPNALWNGDACVRAEAGEAALARGAAAVAAFRPEEAVRELEAALAAGPHRHETLIRIHEQLGIAHAYLGDEASAAASFASLLTIAPRHLLSYTLSPKVTFVFERVRREREGTAPPAVDLSWPRDLVVTDPVPVDVEVIADPERSLARATVELRRKGEAGYRAIDLALAAPGAYRRVVLPGIGGDRPDVLQLYVRAYDRDGNEVLRWGSADRPREIALGYEAPVPWYRAWWVWAVAGSAVALATGVTVYVLNKEPPATVGGGLGFER